MKTFTLKLTEDQADRLWQGLNQAQGVCGREFDKSFTSNFFTDNFTALFGEVKGQLAEQMEEK